MTNINEMPAYANEYTYIVACKSDYYNEYWFYGAYNSKKLAERIAEICNGTVFNSLEVKTKKKGG